MNFFNIN